MVRLRDSFNGSCCLIKILAKEKAKEAELAMWKRRASYDPLKAAAEGRKKAEEAKRMAQQQQMMMSSER